MNQKKIKKLRKLIKPIQLEWLRGLLTEEEGNKITMANITEHMPQETHIKGITGTTLSFMCDKWVLKQLKKHPDISSYEELKHKLKL